MKKRYIVLLLALCLTMITSCGKKEEETTTTTDESYVAINDSNGTTTETTIETTTEVTTESIMVGTNTDAEPFDFDKIQYNAMGDENYEKESNSLSMFDFDTKTSTMLIDGHKITLPCTYNEIVSTFGEPYKSYADGATIEYAKDTMNQYSNITREQFYVPVKTGKGTLSFIFTSEEPCKLKDSMCTGVVIEGLIYNSNDKLFNFSLKGDIHFGSTIDDISAVFGNLKNVSHDYYTVDYSIGSFSLDYSNKDYILYFDGLNNGLYSVTFEIK